MEHKIIGPGPYRATKLWNEIIELFRAGMSLRKHRVHFRSYDKCFSASEAIEYLHDLLRCNQNFGPDVSHSQTIQLLKKFLKNHVIEDVKGRWGTEDFEDNGCLYRFPPSSPLKSYPKKPMYRSDPPKFPGWGDNEPEISREYIPMEPISMNSDLWYKRHSIAIGEVPACRLIHRRELLNADIEEIWKSTTLLHLQKILGLDSLNDVLDAKLVNPKHIMHSVYSTNKQGVVILEDKSEELPHWVLSAMKCLANWPNCSDLKQPMYVGFEKDVFKTVADYHSYLKEPLLTYQLFDAFVNVLALSGFVSLPVQSAQKENSQQFPLHIQQHSSENEKRNLVLSSSMSIESLMLSLSRKQRKPNYPDVIPKLLERSDLDMNCMKTRDERDLTTISQYFLSSNSTQFIPYFNQEQSNKHSIYQPSLQQCASFNMRKASVLFSEDNIYHGGSLQNLRGFRDEFLNPWVSTYRLSSLEALPDVGKLEKKHLFPHFASVDNFAFEQEHMRYTSVGKQNRSQSVHYLPTLHEISMPTHDALLSNCQSCNDAYCPGFMSLVSLKEDEESIQGLLQKRQVAIEALQVCCLLLPPENRRKLQLLMRMMARISLNKKMPSLSDRMGNRMLMVQTFSRCILCSKDEVDLDELLATRLVAFMMDNYLEILNIPYSLQTTVEEHVSHLHRVQIKYQGSDLDAVLSTQSYYTRTNTDNFEFQKPSRPEEKFATLLEEIIMDKKLSVKDKKKKLKQFQKSYPGIYKERFPTPESEAALFPEKPKLKPPLLFFALKKPFQPFQRTRSFRM